MTLAAVFCWRPVKNLKVLPFVLDNKNYNIESIPTALLAGAALPLQVDRTLFYGQK